MRRPIIGITTYGRDEDGRFRLPAVYVDAVRRAGGIAVMIPPGDDPWEELFDLIDGLIFAGAATPDHVMRPLLVDDRELGVGTTRGDDGRTDEAREVHRREAGPRQAQRARIALSENGGGVIGFDEAVCSIVILDADNTA